MKTAISIPDDLFESAEALAEELGVSRSQLYATALARLLAEHDRGQVTERLNAVYDAAPEEASRLDPALARLQARSLQRVREDW